MLQNSLRLWPGKAGLDCEGKDVVSEKGFYQLWCYLPGFTEDTETFFFSPRGQHLTKLGDLGSEAYRVCGIADRVTLTDIRSAVTAHRS